MDIYIQFGRLLEAQNTRKRSRDKAKQAKNNLDSATEMASNFGMYEDCGDFYESEYDRAKVLFDELVSQKISAEKYYKKLRLEFIENYGDVAKEMMEGKDD